MATKHIYIGRTTKSGYDQCITWYPKKGETHGIVNVSLITNNINNYDVNNHYNVTIDSDCLISNNETLVGKAGKEWFKATSTRTYPTVSKSGKAQTTELMDMLDMFKTIRDAEKANLDITIIRSNRPVNLINHMTNIISQGYPISELNFHNPKTVGTAISYIRRTAKNLSATQTAFNEYAGDDKGVKLYLDKAIDIRLNSITASDLKQYYLNDPEIKLNKEGFVDFESGTIKHNNSLINVLNKNKENKFLAKLSSSRSFNSIFSTFEVKTRTVEKDGLIGTETYIPRTVHGITTDYIINRKWHRQICQVDQEYLPYPKSFTNNEGKLISYAEPVYFGKEVINAFETLTGYKPATANEALGWFNSKSLQQIIKFNSDNHDFSYNQAEKIISAIKTLENYFGEKLADSITFRKKPNEIRFYSDSERADDEYVSLIDDESYEMYCNGYEDEMTLNLTISELYSLDVKDTANLVINVKLSK